MCAGMQVLRQQEEVAEPARIGKNAFAEPAAVCRDPGSWVWCGKDTTCLPFLEGMLFQING